MKLFSNPPISASDQWTCPTCNQAVITPYCPMCGERPLRIHDLTLRGLCSQFAQAFTSVDGRLIRSFRTLITRPGTLTVAYLRGQRKRYTLPLQLFLVANILFFAMQSLTGTKIFSTPLDQHLHNDIWGGWAQQLVAHRIATRGTAVDLYAPVFNQAVALNAKSLIVLMVPPFALFPALLFYRKRQPFIAHIVFALHFYAFLLLLLCVALAAAGINVMFRGAGLESPSFDHALSIANLIVCAVYLYVAAGIMYDAKGVVRILTVVPLTFAVAAIFLGYRFALFVITLYTT